MDKKIENTCKRYALREMVLLCSRKRTSCLHGVGGGGCVPFTACIEKCVSHYKCLRCFYGSVWPALDLICDSASRLSIERGEKDREKNPFKFALRERERVVVKNWPHELVRECETRDMSMTLKVTVGDLRYDFYTSMSVIQVSYTLNSKVKNL